MNWYLQKSLEAQWKNASLSNNFIFCRVMSENLDLCKDFLEMLLNIQIERLELSETEKTIDVDFLSKGVRFDVYVKDGTGRCFDIEMQTSRPRTFLPGRSVRIISQARTEPRGTEISVVQIPQTKEWHSGSHRTALLILLASMYFQ